MNDRKATHMATLLRKRQVSGLTEAEARELGEWLAEDPSHAALAERLGDAAFFQAEARRFLSYVATDVWDQPELGRALRQDRKQPLFRRLLPYAAAAILAVGIGAWLLRDMGHRPSAVNLAATEILPGGNRATLTLADGRVIDLSEEQQGIVVGAGGITYDDGVSAVAALGENGASVNMLSLTTPKGGTYRVTLPDGTEVWLNAASTITYPDRFDGDARDVEILGEAYFSVASASGKPFKVTSNGQTVEVLGTEFNVSAYPDEHETKTTLVEGKVRVTPGTATSASAILRPGEQATARGATISVQQVDVRAYTSWKSGYFHFGNTPFKDVMDQLARWYDIEVVYQGAIPQETFSGKMDRDLTLNAVLKLLDVSEIRARIEGTDRLIVN